MEDIMKVSMRSRHVVFTLVVLTLLLLNFTVNSFAGPALWYRWSSKLEASYLCSQTSPGAGWGKFAGPYLDARCEKLRPY